MRPSKIPTADAPQKTILLQAVEARRWTLTYGFGFEAQTGQPQNNCAGATCRRRQCNPNGKTGVSPRVLADITRNGLFGRDQSASLARHLWLARAKRRHSIPGSAPSRAIPTSASPFPAATPTAKTSQPTSLPVLKAGFRFTQNFNRPGSWLSRANTFIYEIDFRRVKVAASSLQVYPGRNLRCSRQRRASAARHSPGFATRATSPWMRAVAPTPAFRSFSPTASSARKPSSIASTLSNSSYYSFDKGRFVIGSQHALRPDSRLWQRVDASSSRCPSGSTPAAPFPCADFRRTPPARAILKPATRSAAPER